MTKTNAKSLTLVVISTIFFINVHAGRDIIFGVCDNIDYGFLHVIINIVWFRHEILMSTYPLRFESQRVDKLPADIMLKGTWVSTAIALILTIPALGLFIGLYYLGANIGVSAGIGFGLHFALLAFSTRISKAISLLFED